MAKLTVLQMTSDILNDMDSDPVDSITDTDESLQVAQILKTTYFNIVSQRDWKFLRTLTTLTQTSSTTPTTMTIPATLNKVLWIKYNKKDVSYLEPKRFKDIIDQRDVDADNVDANGYRTDKDPTWWTTYDDSSIVFDSYDIVVADKLVTATSTVYGTSVPTWTDEDDDFTPNLPEKMFPIFLAAAKSTAFSTLKQVSNAEAASYATRGIIRAQNEHQRTKDAEEPSNRIDYGRK